MCNCVVTTCVTASPIQWIFSIYDILKFNVVNSQIKLSKQCHNKILDHAGQNTIETRPSPRSRLEAPYEQLMPCESKMFKTFNPDSCSECSSSCKVLRRRVRLWLDIWVKWTCNSSSLQHIATVVVYTYNLQELTIVQSVRSQHKQCILLILYYRNYKSCPTPSFAHSWFYDWKAIWKLHRIQITVSPNQQQSGCILSRQLLLGPLYHIHSLMLPPVTQSTVTDSDSSDSLW